MSRRKRGRPDPTPEAEHNYIPGLLAYAARQTLTPGTVVHVAAIHDDWCGIWQGRRCHCQPTFRKIVQADTPQPRK